MVSSQVMVCRTQLQFKVGSEPWMMRGLIFFTCPKVYKSANRFDQGLKPEPPECRDFMPNTTTNVGNNTFHSRWCCSSNCCVSIFHMLGLHFLHTKFLSGWVCPTQWLQLPTQNTEIFVKLSLQKFIFHGIQEFNKVSKKTHLTLSLTTPI